MRGLTPLRGTWIAVAVMSPVLIAQIAFAVPGYFAEDTPGEAVTTRYDTRVDATSPTATSPQGVDAPSGRAEGPGSTAEVPGTTAGVPGNATEGSDRPINHGQVMKQLQELTDGPAPGCLTSAVAQSDLGKPRDQSDGTNTTLASSFADEFDCSSVAAPDGNGSSKVSKDDATTRPDKPNPSDKSKKDSAKSKNGRGKSDK